MYSHSEDDDDNKNDFLSDSENDDELDFETLRRAFSLTGTNPNELKNSPFCSSALIPSDSDDSVDDIQLAQNIRERLAATSDLELPLALQPLVSLPPDESTSDEEDDFATLRAIQKRFSAYDNNNDTLRSSTEHSFNDQVRASRTSLEKESSNNLFVNRTNACEGFPDTEDTCTTSQILESLSNNVPGIQNSGYIEWHQSETRKQPALPLKYSSFPRSAQMLFDAIKKNRSCQKFLHSKLIQIEARIEENKKFMDRVKILKDFQVTCRKKTGRALSQKKDPRVQLISTPKFGSSKHSEVKDKKAAVMNFAPEDNDHVAKYRVALEKFPLILQRQNWSKEERENLGKGIRQEFQKALLEKSVDRLSGSAESFGNLNDIDDVMTSIKDIEITPESIRLFLPKVDWEKFASTYLKCRAGAECEARWLNWEDPLINHSRWTRVEDKNLMLIAEQNRMENWIDISVSLGTKRTPFQCLARYQRSLNPKMLNREWTKEEDAQLCYLVKTFGVGDWQLIASKLGRRAGTQCSNRWKKSLNPARKRVGRWTAEENTRLRVAVMLFGPKTWNKIAQFVPGRTPPQCRERWFNCLNPSLNWGEWTEEEDKILMHAIKEHGYSWSKVAACVPPRTDNQCRRRWMLLCPDEVPKLRAAKKIRQVALLSNFVDRESERPDLGPDDFAPLLGGAPAPENENPPKKKQRKSLEKTECGKDKDNTNCEIPKKVRPKRARKEAQTCTEGVSGVTICDGVDTSCTHDATSVKNGVTKLRPKRKNKITEEDIPLVDRESERPGLGPDDSAPLLAICSTTGSGNGSPPKKRKRKLQEEAECGNDKGDTICKISKRARKEAQTCTEEVSGVSSCDGVDTSCTRTHDTNSVKNVTGVTKLRPKKRNKKTEDDMPLASVFKKKTRQ